MKKIIVFGVMIFLAGSVLAQEITILSPKAGQTYQTGSSLPIHWETSNIEGGLRIILGKSSSNYIVIIKTDQPFDKPFSYVIPHSTPPGDYTVQVIKPNLVRKTSGHFKIVAGKRKLGIPRGVYTTQKPQAQKPKPVIQSLPWISTLSPKKSYPGASLVVTGRNFGATQTTKQLRIINATGSNALSIQSWNNSSIRASLSASQAYGDYKLKIVDSSKSSNEVNLKVTNPPIITRISPDTAAPGSEVSISGNYFGNSRDSGDCIIMKPTSGGDVINMNLHIVGWRNNEVKIKIPNPFERNDFKVYFYNQPTDIILSNQLDLEIRAIITSISPNTNIGLKNPAGLIIRGKGFGASKGTQNVRFSGQGMIKYLDVTAWSDTLIRVDLAYTGVLPKGSYTIGIFDGHMVSNTKVVEN
jgi:hypothetical protein